jgi:hypothetical protein
MQYNGRKKGKNLFDFLTGWSGVHRIDTGFYCDGEIQAVPRGTWTRTQDPPARGGMRRPRSTKTKKPDISMSGNCVGVLGLEPRTPCSQSRCASQLRHTPIAVGVRCTPKRLQK